MINIKHEVFLKAVSNKWADGDGYEVYTDAGIYHVYIMC